MKTQDLPYIIYKQEPLPYSFEAINSYIDKETIEVNFKFHHAEYIDNLNIIIQDLDIENIALERIFEKCDLYPKGLLENAGGYYNYTFLWRIITPNCGGDLSPEFMSAIDHAFNSFEQFKMEFEHAALSIDGSGWAWLVVDNDNKLKITTTTNEVNPLMKNGDVQGVPVIAINMWERMYYLKHQNNRKEYVINFWSVLNWTFIDNNYREIILSKYI